MSTNSSTYVSGHAINLCAWVKVFRESQLLKYPRYEVMGCQHVTGQPVTFHHRRSLKGFSLQPQALLGAL
jgi:hypothetical protein